MSIAPVAENFVNQFHSQQFMKWLIEMTGIKDLIPDPYLIGAGYSKIRSGSSLKIHTDFNWNDTIKVHRMLSFIIYLNSNWKEEWGGHLQFNDFQNKNVIQRVPPLFNRAILWRHHKKGFHGFPDPLTPNYIARVIGDIRENYDSTNIQMSTTGSFVNKSKYVRVKEVNFTTPNYIDSNGNVTTAFTGSIPTNASGTFGSGTGNIKAGASFYDAITETNTQGLVAGNYDDMINLVTTNKDDYKFNVLLTPGLFNSFPTHNAKIDTIITNIQNRGDSIYVLDLVPFNSSVGAATGLVVYQTDGVEGLYVYTSSGWKALTMT